MHRTFAIAFLAFYLSFKVVAGEYNIIPYPQHLVAHQGHFSLTSKTKIVLGNFPNDTIAKAVTLFARQLSVATGWNLQLVSLRELPTINCIVLKHDTKIVGSESYALDITEKNVIIRACSVKGCFYALQTLRQLLPAEFEALSTQTGIAWKIPCCSIQDAPKYAYRGMHLDVSRHFASVEEVEKLIDQLSYLKINTFHWHLTDDQGWRIEIKKYPLLTEVGAYRNQTLIGHYNDTPRKFDQTRYGGFYTQKEIKEVVKYASERFVDILPEIEMPGHAVAALAAYPQFSCSGGLFDVEGLWGVFNDIFCTKEATFTFLQDVLDEVMTLFPYQYIHIGGDECPTIRWQNCVHCQDRMREEGLKDEHQLHAYFVNRIEKFVESRGKKIIGWEEILNPDLGRSSIIMSWRGEETGIKAARSGYDVIMAPSASLYFNYYQSQLPSEPLAIGGYVPIEKVYAYNPTPDSLSAQEATHIYGVQGNLWTEYTATPEVRSYMIFPRVAALAETGWLDAAHKNYNRFTDILPSLLNRYDQMGVIYSKAFYDITAENIQKDGRLLVALKTKGNAVIHYTTDGSQPVEASPRYTNPILLGNEFMLQAVAFVNGKSNGGLYVQPFVANLLAGAAVSLSIPPAPQYSGRGGLTLVDCIRGRYPLLGSQWLGYEKRDVSIEVVPASPVQASNISISFTQQPGQYIFAPQEVTAYFASGGEPYQLLGKMEYKAILDVSCQVVFPLPGNVKISKIKFDIKSTQTVPDGFAGKGEPAWLFIDEITAQ